MDEFSRLFEVWGQIGSARAGLNELERQEQEVLASIVAGKGRGPFCRNGVTFRIQSLKRSAAGTPKLIVRKESVPQNV